MNASVSYRCVRSWDGRELTFAHPAGRPAEDWDYHDGRTVMEIVLQTVVFDPQPQRFSINYEHCDSATEYQGALRRFIIRTSRGTVVLEPLAVSYAATFGMCSVFGDRQARRPAVDTTPRQTSSQTLPQPTPAWSAPGASFRKDIDFRR